MKILEKCNYCGHLFIRKQNAEKYCSSHCRHEAQLESKRKYANKRNLRKNYNTRVKNLTTLGSWGTSSTSHPRKTFEEEYRSIRREMKHLRI